MKKILLLAAAVAAVMTFEGCASSSSVRVTELNTIQHNQDGTLRSFGAANMRSIGPVLAKIDAECSVSDLFRVAKQSYPEASDVINIRMEETTIKKGNQTTYSCKYSGLAVIYKSITPQEEAAWKALLAQTAPAEQPKEESGFSLFSSNNKSANNGSKPAASQAPAPAPAPQPAAEPDAEEPSTSNEAFSVR